MKFNRIIVIVMDSVGAGNAPDADRFGDAGADTLGHIDSTLEGGLKIPTLRHLGLGQIAHIHALPGSVIGSLALWKNSQQEKTRQAAIGNLWAISWKHHFPHFLMRSLKT